VDRPGQSGVTAQRSFTVPEELEGARLDSCLAELHPDWTRSRVRKLIDDGHVKLNNVLAKPSSRVHAGDGVEVEEPPLRSLEAKPEEIPLDVIHEDQDLLLINKPAGLVIHPAAGNPSGTLVNALLHYCQDLSGIGGVERPGIVHRLDKDTSGIMVVAQSDRAHLALSIALRRHTSRKTSLAVWYGPPTITGRTHQIRVHMAHIGHAIVGDPLYAGRQWRNLEDSRVQAACRSFPRQALHARRIAFEHPVTKEDVEFEAPLPPDLQELIETLRSFSG
jgi:23S rRNA pseudouridine1911/1915/1917 synthase